MGAKTIKLHEFAKILRNHNCSFQKTTKEWEVVDNVDGRWVCGFATVAGREVKVSYVKNFLKEITERRKEQDKAETNEGKLG